MTSVFRLEMDDHSAVLAHVVGRLSQSQRAVLVTAKVRAGDGPAVVHDNLNVVRSLVRGSAPLAEEEDFRVVLTELGREVARYLIQSGDFTIPALGARRLEAA